MERLLPGQIVMRGVEHMQSTLAGGITTVRDCGGKDYLEFAIRDAGQRRPVAGAHHAWRPAA